VCDLRPAPPGMRPEWDADRTVHACPRSPDMRKRPGPAGPGRIALRRQKEKDSPRSSSCFWTSGHRSSIAYNATLPSVMRSRLLLNRSRYFVMPPR